MRLTISLAASLALAALLLAACNPQDGSTPAANSGGGAAQQSAAGNAPGKPAPAATPQAAHADGVRRISIQEARAAADSGRAVIFDVRNKDSYDAGHVRGAKQVAYDQVAQHLSEFPKDKLIITYCA